MPFQHIIFFFALNVKFQKPFNHSSLRQLRVIIRGTRATAIRYHRRFFMRYTHISSQVFSKSFINILAFMFSNITASTVSYCGIIVPHLVSRSVGRTRSGRILICIFAERLFFWLRKPAFWSDAGQCRKRVPRNRRTAFLFPFLFGVNLRRCGVHVTSTALSIYADAQFSTTKNIIVLYPLVSF